MLSTACPEYFQYIYSDIHKNPPVDFSTGGSLVSDKQPDGYVVPVMHTAFGGALVQVPLRVLLGQCELSEHEPDFTDLFSRFGSYCVSNKVPGYPLAISDCVSGSGSYYLLSLIAA